MLNITEDYINSIAPNANAIKNGQGLLKKNSFIKLCKDKDEEETLIFAECKGSGSSNYLCSADFIKKDSPVFRCTCPSRQFPCKHSIGLMYAYLNGMAFEVQDVPEDIKQKREKSQKRAENKKEDNKSEDSDTVEDKAKKPKKTNKSAQIKKFKAQIEGLNLLEKLTEDIIKLGLGSFNVKSIKLAEEQAKQFKDFYLVEVQNLFKEFIDLLKNADGNELVYGEAILKLSTLNHIAVKGKEYLEKRISDTDYIDSESRMEELIGHTWQIAELKELGKVEENRELIQLSFNSIVHDARKEFIDCGVWLDIDSGQVYKNLNYRPFKAAKHIKEDDSIFSIVKAKEIYVYPGGMNKRVKWDNLEFREVEKSDYVKINEIAKGLFKDVIKEVRNEIKNPLAEKEPFVLLKFSRIGIVEGDYMLEDLEGNRLLIEGNSSANINLLNFVGEKVLREQVALVSFRHDFNDGNLKINLLSIITDEEIVRLSY